MGWKFTVAVAMLASASCGGDGGRHAETNTLAAAADGEAAHSGARFRYEARGVYEALLMESCHADPTLRHTAALGRENAAIRGFEGRVQSLPPGHHLEIARSDIAYQQTSGMLGCWENSDPRFAERHVQMARERVRNGLREMETLAPQLANLSSSTAGLEPPSSAQFRSLVRTLVASLEPLCPIDDAVSDDQILAPARAELARFIQRLQGTPYALHFALAAADAQHERSMTVAECLDPASGRAADAARHTLGETRRQLARIAAIAHL